jgi:hypothetical protein
MNLQILIFINQFVSEDEDSSPPVMEAQSFTRSSKSRRESLMTETKGSQ